MSVPHRALKVVIVEDELLIADMAEEILIENGYEVCGIATTVEKAVGLIRNHKPDLAVIDVRLANGGIGTEIANRLGDLGNLGILYASGNISQMNLASARGHAMHRLGLSPRPIGGQAAGP